MIERREDFRFALKTGHALGIFGEGFGKDLERHVAPELGVPCAIYLSHPARA